VVVGDQDPHRRFAVDLWERFGERAETPRRPWSRREDMPQQNDLSAEVDRILDKILVQGVDSLTPEEKETMKKFSKKQKHDA